MATALLLDRVQQTVSGTPGTGTISLSTAVASYQTFSAAGAVNGLQYAYLIIDGPNWEYGVGTYTSTGQTLSRGPIISSSGTGVAINASSSATVSATAIAEVIATRGRNTVADTAYTAKPSDVIIAYTSLTAARVVTLPAAANYPVGQRIMIVDESGSCSTTLTIGIASAGSDTINGASTTLNIAAAYGYMALESNGSNGWAVLGWDMTSMFQSLPTSLPGSVGILWNNGGVLSST